MNESKWKIAHASVVGTSHLETETGCQDRYDFRLINSTAGEILVAVMADGAGTSEFSEIGAELACSLFIQEIKQFLDEEESFENLNRAYGELWLDYFRQKITEYAEEREKPLREFACTFLAAVVWDKGAAFYQIGDGGIVYLPEGPSEGFCFGIIPEKKIYANATDFLTDENVKERLLFEPIPEPVEELIMFTDGVQRVAVDFKTQLPHEPFLTPMLAPLRKASAFDDLLNKKLEVFLNSPRINEKTDDDKTLFLASRYYLISSNNVESTAATSEIVNITVSDSSISILNEEDPQIENEESFQDSVNPTPETQESEQSNQTLNENKDEIESDKNMPV